MSKTKPKHKGRKAAEALFKNDFFIPIEGKFYEEMGDRRITPSMWCVYSMILRQVSFETGVWHGSAYRICNAWGGQIPQRTIQDNLRKLCEAGYLRSFHIKGDRNDYAVLVRDFPVRFGRWRGHRLDVDATTDPRNPVYVRDTDVENKGDKTPSAQRLRNDPAASAQRLRGVTATTAQLLRNDPAASVYPNARNTPDVPDFPDALDCEDAQHDINNTNNEPDAGADAGARTPSNTAAAGGVRAGENHPVDRDAFIAAIRRAFKGTLYDSKTTGAHRDRALEMASKYGANPFIGALACWLRSVYSETETKVGVAGAAPGTETQKTWLLHEFMESGAALDWIERVRPYIHLFDYRDPSCCWDVLDALNGLDLDANVEVTPEHVTGLARFLEAYDQRMLNAAFDYADDLDMLLSDPAQYVQKVEEAGKRLAVALQQHRSRVA